MQTQLSSNQDVERAENATIPEKVSGIGRARDVAWSSCSILSDLGLSMNMRRRTLPKPLVPAVPEEFEEVLSRPLGEAGFLVCFAEGQWQRPVGIEVS